ncbi:hypothetical protein [Streptomyces sp. NPDC059883]|uniref:hypothetical protein n=1 Tax=unclassified Streptomyces TaxID=2593676 RepID=UPI00364DBC19
MAEAAVAEIVATLTQPAVAAIENVVADLAIQTALNVTGVQDGYRTDQTVKAGVEGLRLNSADGPTGPVPGGDLEIDHDAHGSTGMHLANVQVSMRGKTKAKIGKAKGAHGRARGKDSLTADGGVRSAPDRASAMGVGGAACVRGAPGQRGPHRSGGGVRPASQEGIQRP